MDGSGPLARSLRSLGPQADLRAAAIGAAVLLREHLGVDRIRPDRIRLGRIRLGSPAPDRKPPPRLIAWIERNVPHRAGAIATMLLLLGSAGLGVIKGGHVAEVSAALGDSRNAFANSIGFGITTVAIRPQAAEPGRGVGDRRRQRPLVASVPGG